MEITRNERGFGYITFYSEAHDHVRTRVWVNDALIKDNGIEFPIRGATIIRTEKGSLVMKKTPGWNVFHVEIRSGYRGLASIVEVKGGEIMASGKEYHSPRGNLGETAWALVNSNQNFIEVFGERSGRRVDQNAFAFRLIVDGTKEELIADQEVCELM